MRWIVGWCLLVAFFCFGAACEVFEQEGSRPTPARSSEDETEESRTRVGEPYPYDFAAPPDRPTPIDGTYGRRVSVRAAGGRPVYCQRCAPWRLDAGDAELRFEGGRFYTTFQPIPTELRCDDCKRPPGFEANGHYTVDGSRLELFNDANCLGMRGVYEWGISRGRLSLDVVEDGCPFVSLRAKYLTALPWSRTD